MTGDGGDGRRLDLSASEFRALVDAVSTWGRRDERAQGVTVGDGDILLVRTGHPRRLAELGPWGTAAARAGLHPTAMPFVAERRVAARGQPTDPPFSSTS
jgi:hypothetical protein